MTKILVAECKQEVSTFNPHLSGQDPKNFDAVVIKSPHCQQHMFAAWCSHMINVDAPESSSANLPYLGHSRCPRPIFPLDPEIRFERKWERFQRA